MQSDPLGEDTLEVVRAIAALHRQIHRAGLSLRESSDFSLFEDTVRATEDRYLMEDFSSRFFDLHGTSAFWIGAWGKDGEPVSVQAAKLEDLRDRSLGQLWQQQQRRMFSDPVSHVELGDNHAHDAFSMRGRIVYHGNLWLRKDARGQGLAEALTQLGFLISVLKWSPDYLYGLMAARNAMKGFGIRVGYRRFAPRGTHWITPPEHIRPDDWLVYSNRNDLQILAKTIVSEGPE
ncbi:hypothetical protein [Roseibium limicola]|uniref:Uncharacterized protein n=1 Tax=Roseibium limicola TaxID=2816037 RepID=A0A939J894_9HYPH|nr:hypothetical protein [Roseibium limicola]MBO0344634.1 hypothetical protein [Roseibium limicola]